MTTNKTIKVSVAKGHLLTLGEQLYTESIELVRELVHNAYDADATDVYVTIAPDQIVVEDNGSGMNEHGLTQFFTVGSDEKRKNKLSPRFGRARIGQFGIGKFAALAVAKQFTVETRKGDWVYRVTFDRDVWQEQQTWELPIARESATPLHREGTRVTLSKLTKSFSVRDVERFLKDAVPLRAKKFSVFLNQKRITAGFTPGRHIPISVKTIFGLIEGEIIITILPQHHRLGIECRVKQALITHELFGLEEKHHGRIQRLAGSVNADWLPITASRTDFIRDSTEFKMFAQVMYAELTKILSTIKDDEGKRHIKKITEELEKALHQIRDALKLHPEFTPSGRAVAERRKRKGAMIASTLSETDQSDKRKTPESSDDTLRQQKNPTNTAPESSLPIKPEIQKPQVLKKYAFTNLVSVLALRRSAKTDRKHTRMTMPSISIKIILCIKHFIKKMNYFRFIYFVSSRRKS